MKPVHKLLELATYLGLQVMALVLVGLLLALCVLAVKAWDWLRATGLATAIALVMATAYVLPRNRDLRRRRSGSERA